MRKDHSTFRAAKTELESPTKTRQQILGDLQALLKKQGLAVEILPEEGLLRLSEQSLSFPSARAVPDSDKLVNLGILAKALTSILPCYSVPRFKKEPILAELPAWCQAASSQSAYSCNLEHKGSIETIMIEGHTDGTAVRAGAGYLDNLALSAARATTVLRLLRTCDAQIGELFNKRGQPLLGVSGYSDLRPVIKDNPNDPRNRRIDIRLVMDPPNNSLERELGQADSPSKEAGSARR